MNPFSSIAMGKINGYIMVIVHDLKMPACFLVVVKEVTSEWNRL